MITILANVGNAGFALPMVQAYPPNIDLQQLLGWNPTLQALDYVPYTGNSLGDFGVGRDLTVTRDATINRNLFVTNTSTFAGFVTVNGGIGATDGGLELTGAMNTTGNIQVGVFNVGPLLDSTGSLKIGTNVVVNTRKTGWAAATGTATRTTFVTSTVTLPQLAERMKALIDDLTTHGLIGA